MQTKMASKLKTAVIPLKGKNYPTRKVLNGSYERRIKEHCDWYSQAAPAQDSDRYAKFLTRDQALAIILLSAELSLSHLVGDPEDLATVWGKLANQFQKRTWANKLELRRNLFFLRLKNGHGHDHDF